jgi:hypothetical protein
VKPLELAETIDSFRMVPRILVGIFTIAYIVYFVDQIVWVKEIYKATGNIPTSVATFSGATLSALGGILSMIIGKYFTTGRKWGNN